MNLVYPHCPRVDDHAVMELGFPNHCDTGPCCIISSCAARAHELYVAGKTMIDRTKRHHKLTTLKKYPDVPANLNGKHKYAKVRTWLKGVDDDAFTLVQERWRDCPDHTKPLATFLTELPRQLGTTENITYHIWKSMVPQLKKFVPRPPTIIQGPDHIDGIRWRQFCVLQAIRPSVLPLGQNVSNSSPTDAAPPTDAQQIQVDHSLEDDVEEYPAFEDGDGYDGPSHDEPNSVSVNDVSLVSNVVNVASSSSYGTRLAIRYTLDKICRLL